jgi:energy-converting hydrogenase B subunit D
MTVIQVGVLVLIAAGATSVVLTRDPLHQAMVVSFYGLLLGIFFLILQAPDVGLSEIVVGAVALPLMIVLALVKIRQDAP